MNNPKMSGVKVFFRRLANIVSKFFPALAGWLGWADKNDANEQVPDGATGGGSGGKPPVTPPPNGDDKTNPSGNDEVPSESGEKSTGDRGTQGNENPPNITKKPGDHDGGRGPKPSGNDGEGGGKPPKPEPKSAPGPKLALICRKGRDGQWQILLANVGEGASVTQGGVSLSPSDKTEYSLQDFTNPVQVQDNGESENIDLFSENMPLLFKLGKNWQGNGRQVKHIKRGCYIAIVPHWWNRIGNEQVEAKECVDEGFSAHYFFVERDDRPDDGFKECGALLKDERFSLKGKSIADDSDMGDVFVGGEIALDDTQGWQGISWVRVGEEGGGKWGKNYDPNKKGLADAIGDREGWFYVRIYDEKVKLVDSFDFRRLMNLQDVLLNGKPLAEKSVMLPQQDGHKDAVIQFVGEIATVHGGQVEIGADKRATIPADPSCDITNWTLTGKKRSLGFQIYLPRVWWQLRDSPDDLGEWQDTALSMSRDEYHASCDKFLVISLPAELRKIYVGFSFEKNAGVRDYTAVRRDSFVNHAKIPLRNFADYHEIENLSSTGAKLQAQVESMQLPLIHITADKKPPSVPSNRRRFRPAKNRCFSVAELSKAGIGAVAAKKRNIAVSRRRKTCYNDNVEQLIRYLKDKNYAD